MLSFHTLIHTARTNSSELIKLTNMQIIKSKYSFDAKCEWVVTVHHKHPTEYIPKLGCNCILIAHELAPSKIYQLYYQKQEVGV